MRHQTHRPTARRRRLGRLATGTLAITAFVAPASPARADDTQQPPVLGSVQSGAFQSEVDHPATISLHGVRRLDEVTVVYYSVGTEQDMPEGTFASSYLPGAYLGGTPTAEVDSDAVVIDRTRRRVHAPLVTGTSSCLACSDASLGVWALAPEAGTAMVAWVAVPSVPADVERVDVIAGNRLFLDVAVEDGPLEPQVSADRRQAPLLGQGWPHLDLSRVGQARDLPRHSLLPLSSNSTSQSIDQRRHERATDYDLSANVLFDKDSDVLKPAGRQAVQRLAKELAPTAKGRIAVTGYTDDLGSAEHGLDLSRRRAAAVATALRPLLPAGVELSVAGKGEADPVASNQTEAGRQKNRRVTVTVQEG